MSGVPTIYEIGTGERRPVTQADVDRWLKVEFALTKVRKLVQDVEDYHLSVINELREEIGLPPFAKYPRIPELD